MALARYYKVGVFDTSTPLATAAAVATTTPTPILAGTTASTSDLNISAVRVSCQGASSFPSNASFVASLVTVAGTAAGGESVTPVQLSGVAKVTLATWLTAGGTSGPTAITGLTTFAKILWSQTLPFTAGANWGEWFTPGFELNVPVSTIIAMYITQSTAGTSTTFSGEIEYTE